MCLTKKVYSTRFHNTKMMTTFAAVAIWVKSMCSNGDNFKGGVLCVPECFSTQYPPAFLQLFFYYWLEKI
jgi:hypothetical protein